MQEVTISGEVFKISPRYEAGHVLLENEAGALNQTFFENVRNNCAKEVAAAKEDGSFDQDVMQDKITQYANEYEFGARRGPSSPKDPVMAQALSLAKKAISKALVAKYGAKHGKTTEEITEAARTTLAHPVKGEKYLVQARQIIEITRAEANETLEETGLAA
jgi:hypothetical protein